MLDKSDSIYLILIFLFMKYFKLFRINIKNKVRFYGINFVIYMIIFYVIKYLIVNVTQKKLIEGHKFYIDDDGELAVDGSTRGDAHLCEIVYGYSDINLMDDAEQICKEPVEGGPGNCSEYPGSECPGGCNLSDDTKIPGDRFECSDGTNECWRRAFINQSELEKNHCIYDEENDNWVPNPTNNTIMSMSTLGRNIECKCNVNQHRHLNDNEQDCGTDADTDETVGDPARNCNHFPLENLRQNNGNLCTSPTLGENDSCNDNTVSSDIIDILLENDCSMLDGEYRINDKCKRVSVNEETAPPTLTFDGYTTDYVTSDLARYIIDGKCGEFVNTGGEQCIARDLSINDETDSDEVQAGGYLFCINPVDTTDDNSCEDNTISEETFQDIISEDLNLSEIYNRINNECSSVLNINGQQCIANPDIFTINTDCQGHWSECGEDLSYCQRNGEKLEGFNQDECTGDGYEWIEDIVDQCERKYVIDQPTIGQGVACEYSEGETETCQAGEGQCPTSSSWHLAEVNQTCDQFCNSIGKTCGVNTNSFSNGGIFPEDLEGDGGNLPTFPNQRWYGRGLNDSSQPLQTYGGIRLQWDGTRIHENWYNHGTTEEVNSIRSQRPTLDDQPILDFFDELDGFNGHIRRVEKYAQLHCEPRVPDGAGGNMRHRCGGLIRGTEAAGWTFFLPDWKLNPENICQNPEEMLLVQQNPNIVVGNCAARGTDLVANGFDQEHARKTFCETGGNSLIISDQTTAGPSAAYHENDRNICWCE